MDHRHGICFVQVVACSLQSSDNVASPSGVPSRFLQHNPDRLGLQSACHRNVVQVPDCHSRFWIAKPSQDFALQDLLRSSVSGPRAWTSCPAIGWVPAVSRTSVAGPIENSTTARFRRIPAGLALPRSFLSPASFRGVSSRPLFPVPGVDVRCHQHWVPEVQIERAPVVVSGCQDCSPTECEVRTGNDVADSRHESGYCGIHLRIKFQRLAFRVVAHLPDEMPRGTDTRGYAGD